MVYDSGNRRNAVSDTATVDGNPGRKKQMQTEQHFRKARTWETLESRLALTGGNDDA
jgi:hypothetical protein